MTDIIEQLKDPDIHFPGNFDTPKRANAMLSCLCQEAAEEIEALRAEIEQMSIEVERYMFSSMQEYNAVVEQLAASQAREQQLREYLHRLACLGNGAHYGTSDGNRIAQVALALQQDTTALQAMIAKAGEVMRKRAIAEMADIAPYEHRVEKLNSIQPITLDDLK